MSHLVSIKEYTDAASMIADAKARRAMFFAVEPQRPVTLPPPRRAPPPSRETGGHLWSESEVAYLRQLAEAGKTKAEAAKALRRTEGSVSYKCGLLRIYLALPPRPRVNKASASSIAAAIEAGDYDASLSNPLENRARAVLRIVSRLSKVSVVDITSERKAPHMVLSRWIACWLLRTYSPMSLPAIGKLIGGRDHSTIFHAVNGIASRMERDPAFAKSLKRVGSEVKRLYAPEAA